MTNIEKLAAACKGSVTLEANPHRDNYESPQEYLERLEGRWPEEEGPPPEEMVEIEAGAALYWLQWYPNSPVGFNRLYGANLERLLREALKSMGIAEDVA